MKKLYSFIAAGAALAIPCLSFAQTSPQQADPQQDGQLQAFLTATYGLEADNNCQLFSHLQREAVSHFQSTLLVSLRSRYNLAGLEGEAARIETAASDHWQGCLPREANTGKWELVEQAALYGDAVLAAPGAMPESVTSCAAGSEGPVLTRAETTSIRQEVLARYTASQYRSQLEAMSASIAAGMAAQCSANGFSDDLKPAYVWKTHKTLEEKTAAGEKTSISEFGPWTGYRFFAFQDFDEFPVSAYRTSGRGTGRLVSVPVTTSGALGASGKLFANDDGSLSVALSGAADAFEIRAEGIAPVRFQMSARSGGNNFLADSQFVLDKAQAATLLALPPETELGLFYQPGGRETWRQFHALAEREGVLPVGRLNDAIAWARAPAPD